MTAAGTGCAGSLSDMLNQPFGIYVDDKYDLYVADSGNNRVQRYLDGVSNGTTVAGETAPISYILDKPTSVILDGDGYLFIVDSGNQRIIREGPNGYECLIGCSMLSCELPTQLCDPLTAIFDSNGNIFVTNQNTNGIQKFILSTNSCGKL
jgi:DNA-binding beta-propeller fold protein YncE